MADFNESIRLNPTYAMAYFFRGDLYKTHGDFDRGLADLNELIRLDPNYAMAYFTRGNISYIKGNNVAAVEDFNKAIQLDPKDEDGPLQPGVGVFFHRRSCCGRRGRFSARQASPTQQTPTPRFGSISRRAATRPRAAWQRLPNNWT